MNAFRKLVALFIMVFIAIPILFGITWAVGITKAVVSPEFLSEMPQEVIARVPGLVDDVIEAMKDEEFTDDENARQWIRAISEAETTPRALMEEIGLLSWLQNELTSALQDIGDILRGEMRPRNISLNMKPLKKALQHPAIERYVQEVVSKFPPCDVDDLAKWQDADFYYEEDILFDLPACQPDPLIVKEALAEWHEEIEDDIPDSVEMIDGAEYMPRSFGPARTVVSLTYLLFLVPAAFIAIGALIGAGNKPGFLQWFGMTTMVGGGSALALALFARSIFSWGLDWVPYDYSGKVSIQFQDLIFDKVGHFLVDISHRLFNPVVAVAGVVCVVGLVIFALSFAMGTGERRTTTTPAPVAPAEPSVPKEPEVEEKPAEKQE